MSQAPYFGSVEFTDPDGQVWIASSDSAFGYSSGEPGPVQTCLVKFVRGNEVRLVHDAPLTWKDPTQLADLFARSEEDEDDE